MIAGGCSGDRAWPAHPDWFRAVRDQCTAAGVAFFFKQWGEWAPLKEIGIGEDYAAARVGKAKAGRVLDGMIWNEFPAVQQKLGAAA